MATEISPYKVFAGSKGVDLANRICEQLGCQLGSVNIDRFSDGEFAVSYNESVRGHSVYLVQPTCPTTDNLMELLLMIDAAKRASAYKVIAVIPYFGWARQDRKDKPRVSIGAKLVSNMIQSAGADRVITVDLHADQIQGFFDIPVDHIYGSNVLAPYVASLNLKKLIVASPDVGGTKRAATFAKKLHGLTDKEVPMVICYKHREVANQVIGRWIGSFFRPSYDNIQCVVFWLNTVSSANLLSRASIYRGAAAPSPVRIFPQFP